jgi:hypothetical protein
LNCACADEQVEGRGEGARERGCREDGDAGGEDRDRTAAREEGRRERRECQREVVRGQRPGERRQLDVVPGEDLWESDRDDRRVGEDDADREAEQCDADSAVPQLPISPI